MEWLDASTIRLILIRKWWQLIVLLDPVPKPDHISACGLSLLADLLNRCSSNQIQVYYKHKTGELKGKYFCAES